MFLQKYSSKPPSLTFWVNLFYKSGNAYQLFWPKSYPSPWQTEVCVPKLKDMFFKVNFFNLSFLINVNNFYNSNIMIWTLSDMEKAKYYNHGK